MNPKYKKIIIVFAILTLIAFLLSFFIKKSPQLLSSYPSNNSNLNDPNSPIALEFDQKIDINDYKFVITPIETFTPIQISDTEISISFSKSLLINSKYTLIIQYKNEPVGQIVFTTNAPPGTQFDARFNQDIQNELDAQYPLIAKTPYETPTLRVVYSAPMTLEITIKNRGISSQKATEEVRSWVTSVGGDATTHKYIISNQSLPSSPTINNLQSPLTPFSTGTP